MGNLNQSISYNREDSPLIRAIAAVIHSRQYDRLPPLLERLTARENQYSVIIESTTPPDIIKQLRDSNLKVFFKIFSFCTFDYQYRRSWQDLPNIVINRDNMRIPWNDSISQCLIDYCLLARIPFTIFDNYDSFDQFDLRDIEQLDEDNKSILHQLSTKASKTNNHRCLRLLKQSTYSKSSEIVVTESILPILRLWLPWSIVDIDQLRSDINCEELYTSRRFNNYWRCLTPQQIIERHFDPNHLLRIGVEVPDINLALADPMATNILTLKRLLPYSNPSKDNIAIILDLIDRYDRANNHITIHIIVLLVRYKRDIMMDHADHPFVRHLLEISSVMVKNSRSNVDNH